MSSECFRAWGFRFVRRFAENLSGENEYYTDVSYGNKALHYILYISFTIRSPKVLITNYFEPCAKLWQNAGHCWLLATGVCIQSLGLDPELQGIRW